MATSRRSAHKTGAMDDSPETESATPASPASATTRNPPYLPTPLERMALASFPLILVFGTVYSLLSPETRSATYDAVSQSHDQDPAAAPSYFARKSNVFNVVFVKRGWAWTSLALGLFLLTHPSGGAGWGLTPRRLRAGLRWLMVTGWWFIVTRWCLGPPLIDRGFRWTGGRCDLARREVDTGGPSVGEMFTAAACKAAGGQWDGGHDISGHVFLLVLGTALLMHEVGWPLVRWSGCHGDERCVIMPDGALKGAGVEAETPAGQGERGFALGAGGKIALGVAGLNLWMLLMTAIYFHTWFEKLSGLLTALAGIYVVYMVPRFVPALRAVVGLPGI